MATLISVLIGAGFALAIGFFLFRFFKSYFKIRGKMLVTCPETKETVTVEVDAKYAALTAALGEQNFTLSDCTRWPERQECGQECLHQIEGAPENCLVRTHLTRWYQQEPCAYCGKKFDDIHWHDHKPALLSPDNQLVGWENLTVEKLHETLETHRPVCWNCLIAETFRREHPDLVTDRPWNRGHLV